jgi:hypothetical protein
MERESDMTGVELLLWCYFFAIELAWMFMGVEAVLKCIYKQFRVDDLNRVLREVEELRRQKSEAEREFDRHYYSKYYVQFENET